MSRFETIEYVEADRRYWRWHGNRRVRKRRLLRTAVRYAAIGVLVSVVATGLYIAAAAGIRRVVAADTFRLSEVFIQGSERADRAAIAAVVETFRGDSLFLVDLEHVARVVERQPWVAAAIVRREFPNALRIELEESVPVALARVGDETFVVDRDGALVERTDALEWGLPVLTGLDHLSESDRTIRIRAGVASIRRLREYHAAWVGEIASLDLAKPDRIAVTTVAPGPAVLLDPDRVDRNVGPYLALSSEIGHRVGRAEYVDLRWKDRIAVKRSKES